MITDNRFYINDYISYPIVKADYRVHPDIILISDGELFKFYHIDTKDQLGSFMLFGRHTERKFRKAIKKEYKNIQFRLSVLS